MLQISEPGRFYLLLGFACLPVVDLALKLLSQLYPNIPHLLFVQSLLEITSLTAICGLLSHSTTRDGLLATVQLSQVPRATRRSSRGDHVQVSSDNPNSRLALTDLSASHIFCLPCSETLGLANPDSAARSCPACNTHLANPDDAVVTHLSPTEDYKTSVLSGLTPGVIMECASRGVAFWSYQATQEMHVPATPPRCFGFVGLIRSYSFYQEFLMKSMSEKYQSLSGQMDKLINDANTEISGLRDRLSSQ